MEVERPVANEEREARSPGGDDWRRRALAAERTVEVLKRKVQRMYNEGAQTAIHRQLERARQREEKNRQRRELFEVRAEELQRYSEHLEVEVARRTEAIQTILDNVTFGFLIIDHELRIEEGFTRSCTELFGRELAAGDDLAALLRIEGSVRHSELLVGLDQVFEDLLPEEVTLDQLPQRFEVGERVLRVEGRAVRDGQQAITGLLLTISDITALEEAQQRSRRNEVLMGILRQRPAFEQFVADSRARIQLSRDRLGEQELVRRAVHTIKGNAASYGLDGVVAAVHAVEMAETIDAAGVDQIDGALRGFLSANESVIGVDYDADAERSFALPEHQLQRLRLLMRSEGSSAALQLWAAEIVQRPASELLGPLGPFVERLAERLNKEVELVIDGGDLLVDAELMRPVFRNLPHLIRNAVDHGIEAPHERGDKPPRGALRVRIGETDAFYEVEVCDDGRGVLLDRLCERAIELGLESAESLAAMDEEARVRLIFRDGLSAAEIATDISGRGVGMSAVKAAVEELGGEIRVQTAAAEGTQILLRVRKSDPGRDPA